MEENQKRTSGGRNENRRSNNSRTRREGNAQQPANRGSNAQPKFDPHFVSAPEATPCARSKRLRLRSLPQSRLLRPRTASVSAAVSLPVLSSAPTAMIRAPSSGQSGMRAMPARPRTARASRAAAIIAMQCRAAARTAPPRARHPAAAAGTPPPYGTRTRA